MPVPKITADQFATDLNSNIQERNSQHDTEIGPIPDIVVQPLAFVLENQNDRTRNVSQLILLDSVSSFTDSDVDDFVFNEVIIRNQGGRSSTSLLFYRATTPQTDLTVQQNFPVATQPDESTGETVIFVTTESKTLPVATASAFFNLQTGRYEIEVAARAAIAGKLGEVGPGRINRPLRPLAGFDTVENKLRSSSVTDRETNTEVLERYRISILATQFATRNGIELAIKRFFPDAGDVLVVNAGDPLITRSGTDSGAVDIFITGSQSISRSDSVEFIGVNQIIVLTQQPVVDIVGITGFVLGTDYELVKDASGVSNSTRAQDGIRFIIGGSSPSIGDTINVGYLQDSLIADIQAVFDNADNDVGGQDPLVRSGTQVDIVMASLLTVISGFSFTTIRTAVITAIVNFINNLGLGEPVELSDLQAVVRSVSGVDNFVFTLLDRSGGTGLGDIPVFKNEFPRIAAGDITIT